MELMKITREQITKLKSEYKSIDPVLIRGDIKSDLVEGIIREIGNIPDEVFKTPGRHIVQLGFVIY